MIRAFSLLAIAAWLLVPVRVHVQTREPIIDVHLHAAFATAQGPPPLAMCTPLDAMPLWTQQRPYAEEFLEFLKKPRCPDPIWSPTTDAELMAQTIAIVRRLNVFGVLSGNAARVDTWKCSTIC